MSLFADVKTQSRQESIVGLMFTANYDRVYTGMNQQKG